LNRRFSGHILLILLFLLVYVIINQFIYSNPPVIGALLLLLFTASQTRLINRIQNLLNRTFYLLLTRLQAALDDFNTKLNGIVDYHQLLAEFYALFNTIFIHRHWALYVFESNNFHLNKTVLPDDANPLPLEISCSKTNTEAQVLSLEAHANICVQNGIDVERFRADGLDTLIPIPGKTQTIALLFTTSRNLGFLKDKTTKALAKKVLLKSGQILENTAFYLDLAQRNLEVKKLFEVSQKLLSSLNTDEILAFILNALDQVSHADASVIFLTDSQTGNLYKKISRGYEGSKSDLTLKMGEGACGWVAQNRKTSVIEDVLDAPYYFAARPDTRSQIALPLMIQDEVIGVLCLESNEIGYFSNSSMELLNIFAGLAAVALNNARQYEISQAKQLLEHELLNASKVQQVLLPRHLPVIRNLNISFTNIPSKMVSGDLLDLVPISQNLLGFSIGDVSGKGAGAAILMSLVLAGFRSYKKSQLAVCEVVARLNSLLEESLGEGRFVTFFYGVINIEKELLTFTNAGHNPPILIREDNSVEYLSGGGIVLGYLASENYIQKQIPFVKGDTLVCYTDGVTEAENEAGEEFGENRLLEVIRKHRNQNSYLIRKEIINAVENFSEKTEQQDDITLLVIKYI
jgi:sigma-B regulation protein RsbU (phosphoserine phosphatase)